MVCVVPCLAWVRRGEARRARAFARPCHVAWPRRPAQLAAGGGGLVRHGLTPHQEPRYALDLAPCAKVLTALPGS